MRRLGRIVWRVKVKRRRNTEVGSGRQEELKYCKMLLGNCGQFFNLLLCRRLAFCSGFTREYDINKDMQSEYSGLSFAFDSLPEEGGGWRRGALLPN